MLRGHPAHLRIRLDRADLAGGAVEAGNRAARAPGEDDVRVVRPDHRDPALHAPDPVPVLELEPHAVVAGPTGHREHLPGVLRRAVHPVGELVVHADPVHLRGRLVELARPGASPVPGDVRAAVVSLDHDLVVARIDPEVVVVAVRGGDEIEGLAGVVRAVEVAAHHVHPVHIHRIGVDVHVVPGPVLEFAVVVDELERDAGVVRAIDAAVPRLNERPHPVRVRAGDRDPGPPDHPRGQAVREFRPGVAAVRGLVDAALLAARDHGPGLSLRGPHGRVEHVRVRGVHGDFVRAGALADVEHLLPVRAAVGGPEDAAHLVGSEGVAEHRRVDDVRVLRMDDDPADLPGVAESDVGPALSAVRGLVHPVPRGDVAPDGGRTASHVNDARVGVRHVNGADGARRVVAVRDVHPALARVGRLPEAAAVRAHEVGPGLLGDAGHRSDPGALVGPDHPVLEGLVGGGVVNVVLRAGGGRGGQQDQGEQPGRESHGCSFLRRALHPLRTCGAGRFRSASGSAAGGRPALRAIGIWSPSIPAGDRSPGPRDPTPRCGAADPRTSGRPPPGPSRPTPGR